jgi:hypothetical protein
LSYNMWQKTLTARCYAIGSYVKKRKNEILIWKGH